MFIILLRHIQHISAVGHKDITAFLVVRHVLRLTFFEHIQLGIVIALNPTGFVHLERLPFAFSLIFVLQAVLNDFKLQLSYRSDDFASVELADKELRHTFIHELVDSLIELFLLHGIRIVNVFEHLRREGWQAFEMQVFAGC